VKGEREGGKRGTEKGKKAGQRFRVKEKWIANERQKIIKNV
jgi:hypothetical protein